MQRAEGSLKKWHAKLNKVGKDSSEIELVRQCSGSGDSDGTWMTVDSRSDASMEDKRVYVGVAKKNNIFFVNNIQEGLPAGCSGKTLPALRDGRELPSW